MTTAVSIIPRPLRVHEAPPSGATGSDTGSGTASATASATAGAVLSDGLVIAHPPELAREARWFRRVLEAGTGWEVNLAVRASDADAAGATDAAEAAGATAPAEPGATDAAEPAAIDLRLTDFADFADPTDPTDPTDLADLVPAATRHEAYRLTSTGGRVVIEAPSATGVFYGLQTLRQLLPDSVFRQAPPVGPLAPVAVPDVEIVDAPRFAWRGVHLDVCRHFMPKSFVLELMELVALHKCNVFHFHLTEDQGWRIPIERYPRLTEVGAWRSESSAGHLRHAGFDGTPHGGYYSREDLEEIVAFAAERHVNVLPEIEMPGHTVAAIAAYPELGNSGKQLHVRTNWGISKHVLNLEETTLEFCTNVIDEVVEIFPWAYFHVGGDECPTIEWETSPRAQELMRQHEFTDERQLQGWFNARMAEHLTARGRILVGWDEILEGGAPEGAIVMSWRGEEGGIEAAAAGHDVVMSPQEWLYFDWPYSEDPVEPIGIHGATSVEKVYCYDPVPAAIPAEQRHHVLGMQCQLWTEYVPTPEHAEYLYFPRLPAFAEAAWMIKASGQQRSFAEFEPRLARHLGRLAALGVNYRPLDGPTPGQARTWLAPGTAGPAELP